MARHHNTGHCTGSDMYDLSELGGELYGRVTHTAQSFGLILPDKRLPKPYKKRTVFFHNSKVEGTVPDKGDIVGFMLSSENHEKPKAHHVEVIEDLDTDDTDSDTFEDSFYSEGQAEDWYRQVNHCTDSDTYDPSELSGELSGRVTSVSHSYGFILPEKKLPNPYKRRTVFFHYSKVEGTVPQEGDIVSFNLSTGNHKKPKAHTVEIVEESDDSDSDTEDNFSEGQAENENQQNSGQNNAGVAVCSSTQDLDLVRAVLDRLTTQSQAGGAKIPQNYSLSVWARGAVMPQYYSPLQFFAGGPVMPQYYSHQQFWAGGAVSISGSIQPHCSLLLPCGHPCTRTHYEPGPHACDPCIHTRSNTDDNPVERLEVLAAKSHSNDLVRYHLFPKRQFSIDDPEDLNYRIAESQFLRLALKSGYQYEIESISYYINPVLIRRFQQKRREFQSRYGSQQEAKDVLAFHGTDKQNMDNIVKENFKFERCLRNKYGRGIYLSEFPQVSLLYGNSLLLCKVLPGRSNDVSDDRENMPIQHGYDSHRVSADKDGYGWALVIDNPDQILPCYVIHYRKL